MSGKQYAFLLGRYSEGIAVPLCRRGRPKPAASVGLFILITSDLSPFDGTVQGERFHAVGIDGHVLVVRREINEQRVHFFCARPVFSPKKRNRSKMFEERGCEKLKLSSGPDLTWLDLT